MGGGAHSSTTPIQTPQSTAALAGATKAAGTSQNLSNQFSGQQQQLFNSLYGTPGGSGGAVSGMLDPSKLNVTSPTGVYAQQNTNANTAAAKQYALNAGKINSNAAQSGFGPGTPAGFTSSQQQQNANALADTKGQNFSTATTNQYQDALKNFWNAANMTQSGSAAAGQGALSGAGNAGNIYDTLYGKSTGTYQTGKPSTLSQIASVGSGGLLGMGGNK